jgi:glycosyltransferase involved in cell wall biosynthesis
MVGRQYYQALSRFADVHIYARGGERYARGDPAWDGRHVTWGRKSLVQINGTPIVRSDFERWAKTRRLDVILFNEQQWWPPVLWARQMGIKAGAYVDYYTHQTRPLFEAYDFLICNTRRHHTAFAWHHQADFIPWGTAPDVFRPGPKAPEDRDRLVFFHSCGRNPERKGVQFLLRAFDEIASDSAKLLIHTQVDIRRKLPASSSLIRSLERQGRLEIVQATVGAPGLYTRGDVYCYPSRLEGIGLTVPEALSSGLPVIVPDHPPMNEFVHPEETGLVVPVTSFEEREDGYFWPQCSVDVAGLRDAMETFLRMGDGVHEYQAAARRAACRELTWQDRASALEASIRGASIRPLSEACAARIQAYEDCRRSRFRWRDYPRVLLRTLLR